MPDYTEDISGFKLEGGWQDIVEHGERVAFALKEIKPDDKHDEAFNEFNEWRPKSSEKNDHMNDKTAEKASIEETDNEESPKKNIKDVGSEITGSFQDVTDPKDFLKDCVELVKHTSKVIKNTARKTLRGTEERVYKDIMTAISPYYFDNELVSANLKQNGNSTYILEINVNEDDLKEKVSNKLEEYDEKYERWHVSTKYDSSSVVEVEGTEIEETGDEIDEKSIGPNST